MNIIQAWMLHLAHHRCIGQQGCAFLSMQMWVMSVNTHINSMTSKQVLFILEHNGVPHRSLSPFLLEITNYKNRNLQSIIFVYQHPPYSQYINLTFKWQLKALSLSSTWGQLLNLIIKLSRLQLVGDNIHAGHHSLKHEESAQSFFLAHVYQPY